MGDPAELERLGRVVLSETYTGEGTQVVLDDLARTKAERDAYREALEQIRGMYGRVCSEYTVCEHRSCHDSYSAWALADRVLAGGCRDQTPTQEETEAGNDERRH